MTGRLRVGVCGAGSFAADLIPLLQAHPLVAEVRIAEHSLERRAEQAGRFRVARTYASLEELCASDVDAVVITTQRWLHGPQAVYALRAGKHVLSAVPAAITLDELRELVDTVRSTGLTYMLFETSYYYPAAIYCRGRYARGDMGLFVYAEGEYLHDMSHGFYDVFRRGGPGWERTASFPPLLYATHSIAIVLSVTGARMSSVSALGYVDRHDDGVFDRDVSRWGNVFSDETALFRTSDGGMCRINEFRRVGAPMGRSVRLSIYGTDASYEEQTNARVWNTRERATDVSDLLVVSGAPQKLSKVHPAHRLPREFASERNEHEGSHQFLICDFVEACTSGSLPPNHVWQAARCTAPGIVGHASAEKDGEPLAVPDFGDPPA